MNRIEFYSKLDKYKADKANEEKEQNGGSLSHYGIIGQKWGQRRWQNADGTFNTEGKIRYFGKNGTTKKNKEEKNNGKKNLQDQKISGWSGYSPKPGSDFWINEDYWRDKSKYWRSKEDAERDLDELDKKYDEGCRKIIEWSVGSGDNEDYREVRDHYDEVTTKIRELSEELYEEEMDRFGSLPGKIGGFNINSNKSVGQMFAERMTNKELYNYISYMEKNNMSSSIFDDEDRLSDYIAEAEKRMNRLGSLPGKDLDKKTAINDTIKGLFSNKKDNLPDKIREEAKKLREVGEDKLADKYEKHAKDMEEYRKIGHAPGATEQEIKEARRSAANAYATAYRNKWPLFLIFGPIGGAIIGSIASNAKINKIIDQLGLDRQDKDKFTASDWDAINEAIKESRRKKPKNQTTTE